MGFPTKPGAPVNLLVALLLTMVGSSCLGAAPGRSGSGAQKSSPEANAEGRGAGGSPSPAVTETSFTPRPSPELVRSLNDLWARTPAGCLLVELDGLPLYEANPVHALQPASAVKIATAAVAIEALGPLTRFQTTVASDSRPVDGVVSGDLALIGGGDPVLATNQWAANFTRPQPYTPLDQLADRVFASGVRRVEGRVIGDESRYDDARHVDSWPTRFITDGEIGPLSALSVNDGFSTWGHPGRPFADPPSDAAVLFEELLEQRGIRVVGGSVGGQIEQDGVQIASIESPTVAELVGGMLRESDNGTAELLLKEIGLRRFGEGSTSAGTRAANEWLAKRGIPAQEMTLADGSGLSPLNRASCRALATVLRQNADRLRSALPVAGRTGGLAGRFIGTDVAGRLWAKTGSLDGVTALTGFAENRASRTLTFAFIANQLPRSTSGRSLQDALAGALVDDESGAIERPG